MLTMRTVVGVTMEQVVIQPRCMVKPDASVQLDTMDLVVMVRHLRI